MSVLKRYLCEIKETGLTDSKIARLISEKSYQDVNQSTITRIRNGKIIDPKWSTGEAIRALHCKTVKRGRK